MTGLAPLRSGGAAPLRSSRARSVAHNLPTRHSQERKKAKPSDELVFLGLVRTTYRLAPEDGKPDASASSEIFQTAQWALSSEAAQSLAQMAARSAKGDGVLAALARERQDLLAEWQKRELLRNTALGQTKRNAKSEEENNNWMVAIDTRIAAIDKRLAASRPLGVMDGPRASYAPGEGRLAGRLAMVLGGEA